MSDMDYSRLPREAAEAFNPMIGALSADTLHGVSNILVMLMDTLSEGSPDQGRTGAIKVLEAAHFALRYEASQMCAHDDARTQATENWACTMLDRPVENMRAKLILMLLAIDADTHGKANCSPALLARRAGMGEGNALAALRWLERKKFIALEDEPAFAATLCA